MKTAISIPDPVFSRVERFARRRKMSRSAIFTVAVSEYLAHHAEEDVTERLNQVYAAEDSSLDPALAEAQNVLLVKEQW
jgi:metal-responsive CopG/Arc/MetJ family transcriptional regulator